jgi:hypothetical protein
MSSGERSLELCRLDRECRMWLGMDAEDWELLKRKLVKTEGMVDK